MRVLVTGSSGKIGGVVAERLRGEGIDVVPFDIAAGDDLRDTVAVAHAAAGCDAVFHLAAVVAADAPAPLVFETNVLGTWNVLEAARAAEAERVVFFSSVNALGLFMGQNDPDYLPIDDAHPERPVSTYGVSKLLGDELCRAFTASCGASTICLRPPAVLAEDDYERIRARRAADTEAEWTPFWEYGAFVDVRDVEEAAAAALHCPPPGHVRLLLCADDISATRPGRELAAQLLPHVPWRGGPEFDDEPYRSLVDSLRARELLAWQPRYRWDATR